MSNKKAIKKDFEKWELHSRKVHERTNGYAISYCIPIFSFPNEDKKQSEIPKNVTLVGNYYFHNKLPDGKKIPAPTRHHIVLSLSKRSESKKKTKNSSMHAASSQFQA